MASRAIIFTLTLLALVSFTSGISQAALIGHWPLDGDGTATVGTNGNLIGGPSPASDRFGNPNSALFFNSGPYVEIPGGGGLNNLQQGTISMFVNWAGVQDSACCNSHANVSGRQSNGAFSNNVLGLSTNNPATAGITWQAYNAGGAIITGGTPVGEATWRHVAVTFASGNHTLYLDGNVDGTSGATGTVNNNAGIPFTIGAWIGDGAGFSKATIDDVKVFDTVLSQQEIFDLAAPPGGNGSAVPEPSTFAMAGLGLALFGFLAFRRRRTLAHDSFTRSPLMNARTSIIAVVALALILSLSTSAIAAPTPISPITATANSEFTNDGRLASDLVGGFNFTTGLSAGTTVDGDTGLPIPQHNLGGGTTWDVWLTNNVEPGIVTFDLGAAFNVDRAWIWNYNEAGAFVNRGFATTGTVETSLDGLSFTPLALASNVGLTPAPGAGGYDTPDVVDFGGVNAQFVRLTSSSFPAGDGNFTGLSEVIFFEGDAAGAAVPEPSAYALGLIALLGLGSIGWRRRKATHR